MRGAAQKFFAKRSAVVGALLILVLIAIAAFRPGARDPIAQDIDHGLTEKGAPIGPSHGAWLGTDHLGRDVWSRVAAGAGNSLEIAASATLISLIIGLIVGLVAGYAGGWVDNALMRFVDLVLAFPYLLLAILLAALLAADSNAAVILTLGTVGWTTMARVLRGKAMTLARSEMVVAARALGASPWRIVTRHVMPNVVGVTVVVATLGFAQNLLAEALLSYLGLGVPPPAATWGRMLFEGRVYYRTAPWLVIAPGVAIFVAVIAFNLLGEGLRDAFDPKERR